MKWRFDLFSAIERKHFRGGFVETDLKNRTNSSKVISFKSFVEILPGGSFEFMTDGSEFGETQGAVSFISLLMKFVTGKDE